MNSFIKYNALSILWSLIILIMCLLPGKDIPSFTIFEYDKIVHFIIYLLLALMMFYGWKKQDSFLSLRQHTLIKILIITSSYGFLVEAIQEIFTADRHFEIWDATANALGAIAGCFIIQYIKSKKLFRFLEL